MSQSNLALREWTVNLNSKWRKSCGKFIHRCEVLFFLRLGDGRKSVVSARGIVAIWSLARFMCE